MISWLLFVFFACFKSYFGPGLFTLSGPRPPALHPKRSTVHRLLLLGEVEDGDVGRGLVLQALHEGTAGVA